MEKSELYKQVRAAAGDRAVSMKAVEEFSECISALSNTVVKITHGERISDADAMAIISEIADVIVTLEQVTGDHDIIGSVNLVTDVKLDRLEKYLASGELLKGLMK
jgi:hypothetical protein